MFSATLIPAIGHLVNVPNSPPPPPLHCKLSTYLKFPDNFFASCHPSPYPPLVYILQTHITAHALRTLTHSRSFKQLS